MAIAILIVGALGTAGYCLGSSKVINVDFAEKRARMVERQIEPRGIRDPEVLHAMATVERHLFVPLEVRHLAYEDYPLPIGWDQTISQPYIVALMTELLELSATDRVLEVGTGSGYQAAVLGEICAAVFTVEIVPALGRTAGDALREMGYRNVTVRVGDGYAGWKEEAPFDAVIVTCAPSHVPEALLTQLADGGRMVIPVGGGMAQELVVLRKVGEDVHERVVVPVRFVPMVGESGGRY